MRKRFIYLIALMIIMTLAVGCEKSDIDETSTADSCTDTISSTESEKYESDTRENVNDGSETQETVADTESKTDTTNTETENTTETSEKVTEAKTERSTEAETETETLMVDNSRPDYLHYSFADVRDLENALKSSNKGGVLEGFKAESDACKTLMDKFESSEMKLSYPVIKSTGKVDMTSNISLFSYELYTLPWIWYQGDVDGSRLTVKISYLSKQLTDYASNHSMSETIKYIAPDAPNVENYDSKSSYLMIKESNIIVNGGSCNALISQTTNGETYIQFVMGDIFVVVSGKSSLLTSTFVSNIYFDQLD